MEKLRSPRIELCDALNHSIDNFFLKQLGQYLNKLAPGLIHACPYEKVMELYNITYISFGIFQKFPAGEYKAKFSIALSENGPFVSNGTVYATRRTKMV